MTPQAVDRESAYYELIRPISLRSKVALGFEIVAAYVRVRALLWRRDLPAVVARLRGPEPPDDTGVEPREQAIGVRLGRAVERTLSPLPFDSRCLARSLVLTTLLARRRIPSHLVIGVAVDPAFEAHAWVESRGRPLLPPMEGECERLVTI